MALDSEPPSLPIRVRVYSQIAAAIRAGIYPVGSLLPSEPDLAVTLGVSRPALREALILLEEDGLVALQRGVGRKVVDQRSDLGLERIRPLEALLNEGSGDVKVERVRAVHEEVTDFTLHQLKVEPTAALCMWESVIQVEGLATCLSQEWSTDDDTLERLDHGLATERDSAERHGTTMLAALLPRLTRYRLSGTVSVTATVIGKERGDLLQVAATVPTLLLQQTVRVRETPLFVAKYLLPAGAPHLTVRQTL